MFQQKLISPCGTTTLLHLAVINHDEQLLVQLVNSGINIDVCDKYGHTPLVTAIGIGNVGAAIVLLQNGADPNVNDYQGVHIFCRAVKLDKPELLKLLINKYAEPQ